MKSEKQLESRSKRYVDVKIMGQKFTMASDEPEEYLYKIAGFVNKKIEEIQSKTSTIGVSNLSILAALNIADDYFHSKDELDRTKKAVKTKGKKLIEFLDSVIK